MADSRNIPAYLLLLIAFVLLAVTLTVLGYGFTGWAMIAGPICAVCFIVGFTWIVLERRRVKHMEGKRLADPEGH
ncbi:hypothetical protein FOS14_11930 [Skermania sp. ID1734]|nr:hypothetical protein [Skermania sp. ID1734]TSD99581.1 hypothetical protein FOS14_11930 [Skermania sp. ID1734]